jgi:hypothetical protein
MSTPVLEPVESTYSDERLALVDAVEPGVDLGWARTVREPHRAVGRDAVDEKLWTYEERVEKVTRVAARQPDRFTGWAVRTGPVLDQEMTPHCVCFSGASLRNFHERLEHRRTYVVDAHGWYAETKALPDPWPGEDGTGIPYAAEVARTTGVLMDDPRSRKDDPGRRYKIKNYVALESIEQIMAALDRAPVWFGTDVDRGIFAPQRVAEGTARGEFILPPPNTYSQVGGHAMLAVGYWRSLDALLVKQSWGADYGGVRMTLRAENTGGYFWYPLDYFRADNYYWDAWAVDDEADAFIR